MLSISVGAQADISEAEIAYKNGDFKTALKDLLPLAKNGNPIAQFDLGLMYAQGSGVEQDNKKALGWYLKAANQGYVYAQFNLGLMYSEGKGGAGSLKKAMSWYSKAAQQGDADAEFTVGAMYDDNNSSVLEYKNIRAVPLDLSLIHI